MIHLAWANPRTVHVKMKKHVFAKKDTCCTIHLRWLPPVLHFPESLNFTKGFLKHHDGLVPVVARWCYNSF